MCQSKLLNCQDGFWVHQHSDVHSKTIGKETIVWQYAVILENAVIGNNCNINCHTFIENDVKIGNNVTVKSGVYIWDGIVIEDNVFIGPNVVFTNDIYPRSKQKIDFAKTIVKEGASLGANSTIIGGVIIGEYAMIGAGSVITKDVFPHALIYGNPGRQYGWVDRLGRKLKLVKGVQWISEDGVVYNETNYGLKQI